MTNQSFVQEQQTLRQEVGLPIDGDSVAQLVIWAADGPGVDSTSGGSQRALTTPDWAAQATHQGQGKEWGKLAEAFPECGGEEIGPYEGNCQLLRPTKTVADVFATDAAVYVGIPKTWGGGYVRQVDVVDTGPWRFAYADITNVEIIEKRGRIILTATCNDLPQTEWLEFGSIRIPGMNLMAKDQFKGVTTFIWDHWKAVHDRVTTGDTSTQSDSLVSELERIAALKERGLLNDEEFEVAKRKLLGTQAGAD